MLDKPKAILIIAPMIATNASYTYWSNLGYKVIAYLPQNLPINEFFKKDLDNTHFDAVILGTGQLEEDLVLILEKQQIYTIVWGYIGWESLVPYGEQLLRRLFPTMSNDPNTSLWRYSKYAMNERLKEVSLPYIKQHRIVEQNVTPEIELFLKTVPYPVVVKPSFNSAASDKVYFCNTHEEMIDYIHSIGDEGLLGRISEILVQEKVVGEEYMVDITSLQGEHRVSAIINVKKITMDNSPTYRALIAIQPTDPIYTLLFEQSQKIVTALGVENGFSHIELMITKKGEVKLIELNLRPSGMGGFINATVFAHQHENQYTQANHLLNHTNPLIERDGKFYYIFFLNNLGFTYRRVKLELLEKMAGYVTCKLLKPVCVEKPLAHLLFDSVAFIHLANVSEKDLLQDVHLLEEYEKNGMLFEE